MKSTAQTIITLGKGTFSVFCLFSENDNFISFAGALACLSSWTHFYRAGG